MVAWILAAITFVAAATYAVGGRELMRELVRRGRQMRSTATTALQPPTEVEMQRAAEAVAREAARPRAAVTPISIGMIVVWVGSILIVVTTLFFLTGRDPRKRPRA